MLMLLAAAAAQTPAPKTTPRLWWMLNGAHAAAILADGETTIAYQKLGCFETQAPELYGRYPRRARFYAVDGAFALATAAMTYPMVRSRRRWLRGIGYGLVAWQAYGSETAAWNNSQLSRRQCQ